MRCQVRADIFDPLESEYRIRECTVGFHPDDSIELRIELDPDAQAQAFDIAREVYELKQKSPVLSKRPLELKIWVHDPAVDGQRIVSVNPDSRYGVNLHVLMPGAPGHKKKVDLEEYLELKRKWDEIHWQEGLEERRAAAGDGEDDSDSMKKPSDFYDFELETWDGQIIRTDALKGMVVLVVNTSTDDLFSPQYTRLEEMYTKYREKGFEILDFPCEPFPSESLTSDPQARLGDDEIHARRKSLYGASFPQMKKCNVTAGNEIPLYRFLKSGPGAGEIKWYFTKFVVDRDGKVVRRFQPDEVYDPADSMDALEQYIKSLLDAPVPETEKLSSE
jgi:glutathione peroxidase